ncbi:hypothetical protein TRAPUB_511 [Trametes pubescens]|uniref:Uncharacterized protein n=1 Tax=Trametes pubescens TaxID=154538 RepID=A0A1M2VLV2_TRAPU|nr:hypothetical protein TRAPUB_511 [Trametes pubescens]
MEEPVPPPGHANRPPPASLRSAEPRGRAPAAAWSPVAPARRHRTGRTLSDSGAQGRARVSAGARPPARSRVAPMVRDLMERGASHQSHQSRAK